MLFAMVWIIEGFNNGDSDNLGSTVVSMDSPVK